jgi:L-fuconolactonase
VTDVVLDSHHHLWDTTKLNYELFRTIPELARPYRAAEYDREARALGIAASICVEAASAGADTRQETEWLVGEAAQSELIAGLVAWAPLERPSTLNGHLDWLLSLGGPTIVGVRRSFELESSDFARRPEVAEGARTAGARELVVDLVLFSNSLAASIELVDACPHTQFVLDHLGKPRIREQLFEPWATELHELALRPNVACKLSGLTTEADRDAWSVDHLKPYVEHALDCFGAERLLYGSDAPVASLAGGHRKWLKAVDELLTGIGAEERAAILGGNARRVYHLK